jgi:hypothetical protein
MKFNKNMFSLSGSISKYAALTYRAGSAYHLCITRVMESFFGSVSSREKLQIIYANIRV